ncbi:MAG: HDOD domain-containing protein [Burkholderiaceae bacterium]
MKEVAAGTADEQQKETGALEDFVASVQHLPLYSAMAARLIRSVEREDITAAELSRQIGADAVLASHLLRLANSSFYGMSGRIGTVADAIAVLGLNMVRRIVTSAVLQRPLIPYLHDIPGVREFWRHQLLCAALARHLQVRKREGGEKVAYMAGLLHDGDVGASVAGLCRVARAPVCG